MTTYIWYYITQLFSLKWIKIVITSLYILITSFVWWLDKTIYALLILMVIDFILWMFQAYRKNKFSSSRLKEWLYKFILYWIAMITWHYTDIIIFHNVVEYWFKNFIIVYLWINEALSIIKHLTHYWVKFPKRLIESLQNFRDNDLIINLPEYDKRKTKDIG
jgi:phage-related holin